MTYSSRYDAALILAATLHRKQLRKGTDTPYIVHPVYVSLILMQHGYDEDVAIAGLLHDAPEDQRYPLEDIAAQFGARVADLVAHVSEHRYAGDAERPWETRKQEKLAALRTAPPEALAITAADALHNASSILADLRAHGPAVWGRFKRGRAGTVWYYRAVTDLLVDRLGAQPLVLELAGAVDAMERMQT
jgi:(p)ppGpp synthase/HD superfamily hydrolase